MTAALLELAAQVDVIDLAGRIIADPRRTTASTADLLAMAHAVERFWAICLQADEALRLRQRVLAISAMTMTAALADEEEEASARISALENAMREALAAIRGEPEENQHGSDHS